MSEVVATVGENGPTAPRSRGPTPAGSGRLPGGSVNTRPQIIDGALRAMCEYCGFLLELLGRAVSCRRCGAGICLPAAATEAQCGFCESRWTV